MNICENSIILLKHCLCVLDRTDKSILAGTTKLCICKGNVYSYRTRLLNELT